jgi:hypothetical protein
LVAQRGNIFFVNGNYLDLEFTFFLSEIVGRFGRLARPSPAMITLGSTSAVFALEKFELELALPGKGDKVKIFRRHPQKGYHFEDVIAYEGRLELSLLPFEVVIAKRF